MLSELAVCLCAPFRPELIPSDVPLPLPGLPSFSPSGTTKPTAALANFIIGLNGLEFSDEMSAGGGAGSIEPDTDPEAEPEPEARTWTGTAGGCLEGMGMLVLMLMLMLTLMVSVGLSGTDSAGEALKSEPMLRPLRCLA